MINNTQKNKENKENKERKKNKHRKGKNKEKKRKITQRRAKKTKRKNKEYKRKNKTERKQNNHVRINTWQFVSELFVETFAQNLSRNFSKHRFPPKKKLNTKKFPEKKFDQI